MYLIYLFDLLGGLPKCIHTPVHDVENEKRRRKDNSGYTISISRLLTVCRYKGLHPVLSLFHNVTKNVLKYYE